VVVLIVAAVFILAAAAPAVGAAEHTVEDLARIIFFTICCVVGLAVLAALSWGGLWVYRWRAAQAASTPIAVPLPEPTAPALSAGRQSMAALAASAPSAGVPKELHLHLHTADAATVAAILRHVGGEDGVTAVPAEQAGGRC
jgi:hypothetical protein